MLAARQPGVSLGSKEGKPDRIGQNEQWSRRVPFAFVLTNQITTPLASVGEAAPPLQSVKNRDKLHSKETQNHEKPSSRAHQGSPDQRGNGDCRIGSLPPSLTEASDPRRRLKPTPRGETQPTTTGGGGCMQGGR